MAIDADKFSPLIFDTLAKARKEARDYARLTLNDVYLTPWTNNRWVVWIPIEFAHLSSYATSAAFENEGKDWEGGPRRYIDEWVGQSCRVGADEDYDWDGEEPC